MIEVSQEPTSLRHKVRPRLGYGKGMSDEIMRNGVGFGRRLGWVWATNIWIDVMGGVLTSQTRLIY